MASLFSEKDFREVMEERHNCMRQEVHELSDNQLLNLNEDDFVQYLSAKYSYDPLEIDIENATLDIQEQEVPLRRPGFEHLTRTEEIYNFHIPYVGKAILWHYRPYQYHAHPVEASIRDDDIVIAIQRQGRDSEQLNRSKDELFKMLEEEVGFSTSNVTSFNGSLADKARNLIASRKAGVREKLDIVAAIGVPMRKSGSIPETFSIPFKKKNIVIKKPSAPNTVFKPEPTLDKLVYSQILEVLDGVGRGMERHPSTYRDKDEESLRDVLLLPLQVNFQSATGETFNKTGKTDILIRHEGENAFVAECKIWGGKKEFHEAIDQALDYLTWRDSKAAILIFVKNVKFQPVLDQIVPAVSGHDCFQEYSGQCGENRFQFRLYLGDDKTRSISLAVLCFHFPK